MKKMSKKLVLKKATVTDLDNTKLTALKGGCSVNHQTKMPYCNTEDTCGETVCAGCNGTYTCGMASCQYQCGN